jgi:enoyl-CoA hydratase/carnithine racemase
MTNPILLDFHGGVATLTLNRPHVRNALDWAAMHDLHTAVAALAARGDIRAVLFTGAGEAAFCTGGDLNDLHTRINPHEAAIMGERMGEALLQLEALPVPVIAAVNGYALGGGAELALTADVRVFDACARFGFVQAARGLIPGWGGGQRLLRVVGYARAIDLLLTGRVLDAAEAHALGIATQLAPEKGALPAAQAYAAAIGALDPAAVRGIKALLRAGLHQPYEAALDAERALFPALWTGDAHQQATRAFLESKAARPAPRD